MFESNEIINIPDNPLLCSFCGQGAKKMFAVEDRIISTCSDLACDLQFMYRYNSGLLSLINLVEHHLKIEPAMVLVSLTKESNGNIKPKAGFLLPDGDKYYIWTEIFSDGEIDELEGRVRFTSELFENKRTILVSNSILPEKRIDKRIVKKMQEELISHI